ncbi:MAG: DUF4168 domain-containing protein [Bacteroidia bacterium]
MKKITSLLMIILFGATAGFAQTETQKEVSEKEIEQFAAAFQEVQSVNQEAQQKMVGAVEEQGFDVQRYNEIQQAQQNPEAEIELTPEENKNYEAVVQELGTIQTEAQKKMEEKIEEHGLSIERYQEIASQMQRDPELQKKLQEHMQG